MNDARRKEVQRALTLIEQAKDILREMLLQEQDDFDSMPEDLQNDETGQRAEDAYRRIGACQRRAVTMRCPPARRSFRASQAKRRRSGILDK
jgi:hypothetical protein